MSTQSPLARSPLDSLDSKTIAADEHFPWQPKELVAVLGKHRGRPWNSSRAYAVSPDGKVLASGSPEGSIHLWDTASLRERPLLHDDGAGQVITLAWSRDGKTLAAGYHRRRVAPGSPATHGTPSRSAQI